MKKETIEISTEFIKLDQFLKWVSITSSGVEAKFLIQEGQIKVNGEVETRRGKKLRKNDEILFEDKIFVIK